MPLLMQEIAIYQRHGTSHMGQIYDRFKGLTVASVFVGFIVLCYSVMTAGVALVLFFESFREGTVEYSFFFLFFFFVFFFVLLILFQ